MVLRIGYIFTQPDMFDLERIQEEDFEIKIGSAIILFEYRVQQSPKTQMYQSPPSFGLQAFDRIGSIYVYQTC